MPTPITFCLLRNDRDFEIEVTGTDYRRASSGYFDARAGVGEPPEAAGCEGFTFEPKEDDDGNPITLTPEEEKHIAERLDDDANDPEPPCRCRGECYC